VGVACNWQPAITCVGEIELIPISRLPTKTPDTQRKQGYRHLLGLAKTFRSVPLRRAPVVFTTDVFVPVAVYLVHNFSPYLLPRSLRVISYRKHITGQAFDRRQSILEYREQRLKSQSLTCGGRPHSLIETRPPCARRCSRPTQENGNLRSTFGGVLSPRPVGGSCVRPLWAVESDGQHLESGEGDW